MIKQPEALKGGSSITKFKCYKTWIAASVEKYESYGIWFVTTTFLLKLSSREINVSVRSIPFIFCS